MKILSSLIILFAFVALPAFAARDTAATALLFRRSAEQISYIKQHGVLIRLQTNDLAVNGLRARGKNELADRIIREQDEKDRAILESFKTYFKYCPVYYFKSRDIYQLKAGNFSKVFNLDGTPAQYSGANFFIVDPYRVANELTHGDNEGFSLSDSSNNQLPYPMMSGIVKRRGIFYRTYDQMVYDWNNDFRAMEEFGKLIVSRSNALGSKAVVNDLKDERRRIFKTYRKQRANRPKPVIQASRS